ncbi:MAG: transcription antitermination factor NusB [Alloprevotella sp.]|nr:transcription antitermination factor NusB [Alloprevotella sp.]
MINRELIRLKVVQLVYAYYRNDGKTIETAQKELLFSLGKAYELYEYLLLLLVKVYELAVKKEEALRQRAQKGAAVLDGSVEARLAANALLKQLAENKALQAYRENKKDWIEEEAFVKQLFTTFTESEVFKLYLDKEDFSYEADRELVRKLYKTYICHNEDFDDLIEEHSLYWNDDKFIIDSFVLKTIKRFTQESTPDQPLLPDYASDDDREFAIKLFQQSIRSEEETRTIISNGSKNWEINRLAFMDLIIMQIALTEIMAFPTIPVNVTFNEYLNIAKAYSTPRSAGYINGMLDHMVKWLRKQNKILK